MKEEGKGTAMSQNKFEILSSRVMQCVVEERTIRNIRAVAVRCFKCREERHISIMGKESRKGSAPR